jgi:glycosyltransferase involved in cell wall biosynthesis
MSLPSVSVILPTFNAEERVLGAIRSVLEQDYPNLELIVVDDGSSDSTREVVSRIDDRRLVPMAMPANAGPYAARTAAIQRSSAEILAFIDDDDEWLPEKLKLQVAVLMDHPEVALVHTGVRDVFPNGASRVRLMHPMADSYEENLCQDRIATSTVVLRRSALDAAGGFDTSMRAFGDWDLWVRVARVGQLRMIRQPLATIHLREGSIQRSSVERFERYRLIALEKRRDELKRLGLESRAEALHQYAVAAKLQAAGRSAEARSRAYRALRTEPSLAAVALWGLTFMNPSLSKWARIQLRTARTLVGR